MHAHPSFRNRILLVLVICILAALPVRGQQVVLSKEGYVQPPKEIADAINALQEAKVGGQRPRPAFWTANIGATLVEVKKS